MLLEQFLQTLPRDMAVHVRERRPKTAKKAAEAADSYELARKADGKGPPLQQPSPHVPTGSSSGKEPVKGKFRPSLAKADGSGALRSGTSTRGDILCWECGKHGHIAMNCPRRKAYKDTKANSKPALVAMRSPDQALTLKEGYLDGKPVRILQDTGSQVSIVKASLVDPNKWSQESMEVCCVHGDKVNYPSAEVDLEIDGWTRTPKVALIPNVPVEVVLGLADHPPVSQKGESLMVLTRAQRRQQQQSTPEDTDGETEAGLGDLPGGDEARTPEQPLGQGKQAGETDTELLDGQVIDQSERTGAHGEEIPSQTEEEEAHTQSTTISSSGTDLQTSPQQLRLWQQTDPTLKKVRELASTQTEDTSKGRASFFYKGGLLYRKWSPKPRGGENGHQYKQLQCRALVLSIAHDVPLAGHLGTNKTKGRILTSYYWPGIFGEIAKYCKTCEVCQKGQGRRHLRQAEMICMPIIPSPFQRIAMDVVGPLPRSRSGNKYVLTICDYATRYPEAIALPNIKASRIAKELVKLFTRVGIPEEILTDQGTNFMSTLLQELYRLLNISRIRTSPYHPQTDGLVEKFNGTLKAMMRKFTSKNQKDWDEYLPYLLFAYREAPQESTGFSPFELLYGRRVRGALDVLREMWTEEETEKTTEVTHLVQMRERLAEMTGVVKANLLKAQQKQKKAYDKKVTPQTFKEGDKVLVLLPARQNKLQLQWEGPYTTDLQRRRQGSSPSTSQAEQATTAVGRAIYHHEEGHPR